MAHIWAHIRAHIWAHICPRHLSTYGPYMGPYMGPHMAHIWPTHGPTACSVKTTIWLPIALLAGGSLAIYSLRDSFLKGSVTIIYPEVQDNKASTRVQYCRLRCSSVPIGCNIAMWAPPFGAQGAILQSGPLHENEHSP